MAQLHFGAAPFSLPYVLVTRPHTDMVDRKPCASALIVDKRMLYVMLLQLEVLYASDFKIPRIRFFNIAAVAFPELKKIPLGFLHIRDNKQFREP